MLNVIKDKNKLIEPMLNCYQFKTMSILEHGQDVSKYFDDLYNHLIYDQALTLQWKLPSWFNENKELIKNHLLDFEILKTYQIYHDCGKPYCRVVDEKGQHFPNHANISKAIWLECSDNSSEAIQIAKLIEMDMDIHLLKSEGIESFAKQKEAISLLLTGLAEIHSNSIMFGGLESVGFKIKFKQIDKTGKTIIKLLKSEPIK